MNPEPAQSAPDPGQAGAPEARPPGGRRQALTLWLIFLAFFLPFFLAYGWFLWADRLPLPAATNHGDLVQPPRPLTGFSLDAASAGAFTPDALRGRWSLIYFVIEDCDALCSETLYKMQQVRLALGRDRERVQRVVVLAGAEGAAARQTGQRLAAEFPGTRVALGDAAAVADFRRQFPLRSAAGVPYGLFLVDPLGNLMLAYPAGAAAEDWLADLEKLLKVSQVG